MCTSARRAMSCNDGQASQRWGDASLCCKHADCRNCPLKPQMLSKYARAENSAQHLRGGP